MFEIFITILSLFLFIGSVKLAIKITWGTAKIVASILLGLAAPILILCLIFASGAVFLLPALLIAGAFGLLKKCS